VEQVGCAIVGQSDELAPADRSLYALRDVTATVRSIPLIVASILSKKLCAGLDALVLDVKFGSGAFMPDEASARELAERLVEGARDGGIACEALLTDMDQPIGRCVGNALEIVESIEVLRGEGPADTEELTEALAVSMLMLAGEARHKDEAREAVQAVVASGRALARFAEMVGAQGGDPGIIDDPARLPQAAHIEEVSAGFAGTITRIDAHDIARAAQAVGVGRVKASDAADLAVGIELLVEPGAVVAADDTVARLHWNARGRDAAVAYIRAAMRRDGSVQSRLGRVRAEVR
jgi:pyrimidine-nucleoside phosphorylase